MFHTFQSAVSLRPGEVGAPGENQRPRGSGSRRISTTNACVECRRRKIRCDGIQPCGQCQWYQHPELCCYSKPVQRVVPSRKLVDKLQSSIEQYKIVLKRLFPNNDLDSLVSLPREELLNLALTQPAPATSPAERTGSTAGLTNTSDGADSLEALEEAPERRPDLIHRKSEKVLSVSDNVNGLSMSVDRQTSYSGVSSITAALKVILKTAPEAKEFLSHAALETTLPSRCGSPAPDVGNGASIDHSVMRKQELVKSYFERVHPFFPMVEEQNFWQTFLAGSRSDSSWAALLNMVLALGSVAAGTAKNVEHLHYFEMARQTLSPEAFAHGNIEILQAIGMMSGYYMHFLNQPNEADCLMGAAMRMALTLGLHRKYETSRPHSNQSDSSDSDSIWCETRRRTWWSLFCLDTWAQTTVGRPSLGRTSQAVTVEEPGRVPERMGDTQTCCPMNLIPLIHNIEFCKLSTTVQDRLASTSILKSEELIQLDAEIVRWREDLPKILLCPDKKSKASASNILNTPRLVMKWRYYNLRIVLHRPVLLATSLRRVPFADLSAEEKIAVGKCRLNAAQTIEDISTECPEDLISGWNAVWFVYQACMVPLVSLFTDMSNPEETDKWQQQIETAMQFLERMKLWSVAANRSLEVVSKLLEAGKSAVTAARTAADAINVEDEPRMKFEHYNYNREVPMDSGYPPPLSEDDVSPTTTTPGFQDPNTYNSSFIHSLPAEMPMWPGDQNLGDLNGVWDEMMWDTYPNGMAMPENHVSSDTLAWGYPEQHDQPRQWGYQ